jgi:hypothetical protein
VSSAPDNRKDIGPIASTWLGFSLVAIALLASVASRPIAVPKVFQAALVITIAAGQTFALGVLATALVVLFRFLGLKKLRFQALALVLPAGFLGVLLLDTDVSGLADRLSLWSKFSYQPLLFAVSFLFGMVIPAAFLLGRALARRFFRIGALLLGLSLAVVSAEVMRGLYEGLHLFAVLSSAIMVAAALVGAKLPERGRKAQRAIGLSLMGATTLWGILAVTVVPSDTVRLALLGLPAAVLSPYPWFAPDDGGEDWAPSKEQEQWFQSRDALPDIPPTEPRLFQTEPLVLFITIDSLRADVLQDEKRRTALPFLSAA